MLPVFKRFQKNQPTHKAVYLYDIIIFIIFKNILKTLSNL